MVFVIHWHESAMDIHVFPIPIPPPTSLSTRSLWVFPVHWLFRKDPDAGKDWRQEEEEMTEDEMVGWHHQLNGHEFEQASGVGDGQGGLTCCSPWGCEESDDCNDWVTELNWVWLQYNKWTNVLSNLLVFIGINLEVFVQLCFYSSGLDFNDQSFSVSFLNSHISPSVFFLQDSYLSCIWDTCANALSFLLGCELLSILP